MPRPQQEIDQLNLIFSAYYTKSRKEGEIRHGRIASNSTLCRGCTGFHHTCAMPAGKCHRGQKLARHRGGHMRGVEMVVQEGQETFFPAGLMARARLEIADRICLA